ncbi:MAG: peptide chain release factor N(5)-glutamine methyltransferase [Oscillospiraceae bacterium]|jgi:release factor glutamine methyltransferase|nr:peptide chain release factor N(5)-glutamine methyltransferase [Oscillospiraceae bacterium]
MSGDARLLTYGELRREAAGALRAAGVSAAALEARLMAERAAGMTRTEYLREDGATAPKGVAETLRQMTRRRERGEPAAYITGEWEFYSLPILVSRATLIPRADTETLAAHAIEILTALFDEFPASPALRVLDLCAGTGCVGLAIAANVQGVEVTLADKYDGAAELCRKNIERCALSARLSVAPADALLPPPRDMGAFDMIVCNPPYIPTGDIDATDVSVREYEPMYALDGGADGLLFFRAIAHLWKSALKNGGYLLFECGAAQADDVQRILRDNGFTQLSTATDTGGHVRVVAGQLKIFDKGTSKDGS